MQNIEEWRPIEGWPYEVSSLGRVRRSPGSKYSKRRPALCPWTTKGGYQIVRLMRNNEEVRVLVHRLVCTAFSGPPPTPQHVVAHIDGNPSNNCAVNLRWATYKENEADKLRHGTKPLGERAVTTRLTDAEIDEIRRLYAAGVTQVALAKKFGAHQGTISNIVRFKSRKVQTYATTSKFGECIPASP